MPLAWNAWGAPFLLSALLHAGASILVYAVGPRRILNRALAVTLFCGAGIQAGYGLTTMMTSAADAYALHVIEQACKFAVLPLYLMFLGAALRTPLTRPFRSNAARRALGAAAIAFPAVCVLRPEWFIGSRFERTVAGFHWSTTPGSAAFDLLAALVFLYALACSISAYRRAGKETSERQRAWWFMLAFGTRDVAIGGFILASAFLVPPGTFANDVLFYGIFATTVSVYVLLIVYGVLNWHLFDLDMRIKWTVRRGSLAAIFLGVFLVVTQLAQNGFATRFGWIWGGIAAGLLLLALVPLQRMTERIASAAMPRADGSEEYLAFRRAEVYKGALEEILADGVISAKERAILDTLRARLGLTAETAAALERDAREADAIRGSDDRGSTALLGR